LKGGSRFWYSELEKEKGEEVILLSGASGDSGSVSGVAEFDIVRLGGVEQEVAPKRRRLAMVYHR
jgi:hypothetical protein